MFSEIEKDNLFTSKSLLSPIFPVDNTFISFGNVPLNSFPIKVGIFEITLFKRNAEYSPRCPAYAALYL